MSNSEYLSSHPLRDMDEISYDDFRSVIESAWNGSAVEIGGIEFDGSKEYTQIELAGFASELVGKIPGLSDSQQAALNVEMKTDIDLTDMDRIHAGDVKQEDFIIPADSLGGDFGSCVFESGQGAKFVAGEKEGFCDVSGTVGFKPPEGPS